MWDPGWVQTEATGKTPSKRGGLDQKYLENSGVDLVRKPTEPKQDQKLIKKLTIHLQDQSKHIQQTELFGESDNY